MRPTRPSRGSSRSSCGSRWRRRPRRTVRRGPSGLACPTHVLFNGGVMKAAVLRERVVDVLSAWLAQEGFEPLGREQVLDAPDLDHAVARGAAYYGRARHGRGVRIRSGAPRVVLHRHRERDARRARHARAAQGALRRAVRDGGGHERRHRSGVRPRRRRARGVPLPQLRHRARAMRRARSWTTGATTSRS